MKSSNFGNILEIIKNSPEFSYITDIQANDHMPFVVVDNKNIAAFCRFLQTHPMLYFDFLQCITAVDLGAEKNTFELIYTIYSIPFERSFCVKSYLPRPQPDTLAHAYTVSTVWRSADWHEREAYDLFGIHFEGHPDLRRILLPADWVGFPLRKDYTAQEYYHEVKVAY